MEVSGQPHTLAAVPHNSPCYSLNRALVDPSAGQLNGFW